MYRIGVRELKNQTSEMMRRVRDGERVALTYHGRRLAHVVPVAGDVEQADVDAALDDLDALAAEIGSAWNGQSMIDATSNLRREL